MHRAELVAVFEPQILDGLARQRGDDRGNQDGLGKHHGLRGKQKTPRAERTGPRQREIDRKSHDHRRQAHQRIEHYDDGLAAAKPHQRQQCAERHADQRGKQHGGKADQQRQPHDRKQRRIARQHEMKRGNVAWHFTVIPAYLVQKVPLWSNSETCASMCI